MRALVDLIVATDTRLMLAVCLLVLDAWAIALIWKARPSRRDAILWSAIVLLCPIVGCLFWYALGPKPISGRAGS
ncbi:MAG: PLDc N-terminal domain-containing protein [Gemmatimonadota bacterium]